MTILLFWVFRDRAFDDPYITYRYASNIAEGVGFVYNPGEQTLSTTAPLYALILALGALVSLDIPLFSNALGCVSLALGGLAFWYLGQQWKLPGVGVAGLLFYPITPLMIATLGAETAFYTTVVLFAIVAYTHAAYVPTAILLAIATLVRADAVLAVVALGAHFLLARRRPIPWRAIVLYGVLLLPWFVFAWSYFGAPLPVTLAAKQRQGAMAISQSFFHGLLELLPGYWQASWYRLHLLLGAIGLGYGVLRARSWLLLVAWNVLYAGAYSALGVSRYFWYYGPLAVGVTTLVALGIGAVAQGVRQRFGDRWGMGAQAVLLALALVAPVQALVSLAHTPDERTALYREVGQWLRTATPPDAQVGTLEVGIIGFYADRAIIDFAGLIQPETARQLTSTSTYEDSALWAFHHFQPDYLVLHAGLFPQMEDDSVFQSICRTNTRFEDDIYPLPLVIYTCEWK